MWLQEEIEAQSTEMLQGFVTSYAEFNRWSGSTPYSFAARSSSNFILHHIDRKVKLQYRELDEHDVQMIEIELARREIIDQSHMRRLYTTLAAKRLVIKSYIHFRGIQFIIEWSGRPHSWHFLKRMSIEEAPEYMFTQKSVEKGIRNIHRFYGKAGKSK